MMLGVVCFATVLVSAAVILSFAVSTTPVTVAAPMTLSKTNSGEGLPAWGSDSPAIPGKQYGQNLTITDTTNWVGNYEIQITVSVTATISASDFAISYSLGGGSSVAIDSESWSASTSSMTYTIPTSQSDTGTGYHMLDQFTIQVNAPYTNCVFTFQAVPLFG